MVDQNKEVIEVLKRYGINYSNLTEEQIINYLDQIINYNENQISEKVQELNTLLEEQDS